MHTCMHTFNVSLPWHLHTHTHAHMPIPTHVYSLISAWLWHPPRTQWNGLSALHGHDWSWRDRPPPHHTVSMSSTIRMMSSCMNIPLSLQFSSRPLWSSAVVPGEGDYWMYHPSHTHTHHPLMHTTLHAHSHLHTQHTVCLTQSLGHRFTTLLNHIHILCTIPCPHTHRPPSRGECSWPMLLRLSIAGYSQTTSKSGESSKVTV